MKENVLVDAAALKGHLLNLDSIEDAQPAHSFDFIKSDHEVAPGFKRLISFSTRSCQCVVCGSFLIFGQASDGEVRVFTYVNLDDMVELSECAVKGLTPIANVVPFKSGEVIFADSLDQKCRFPALEETLDYNCFAGQKQVIDESAVKQQVAYGPVGNTSPEVWVNPERTELVVANFERNYTDEYADDFTTIVPDEYAGWECVGYISTDLWAYSFIDSKTFKSFYPEVDVETSFDLTATHVTPGDWEFTHYSSHPLFERDSESGAVVFARAKLI